MEVPEFSKREQVPYVVPEFLRGLKSVQVMACEDMGPATKLVPTLLREPALQNIIVVDDDRIYPANLVRDLEDAAEIDAGSACGMSGWVVPKDLVDRPTTIWANFQMLPPAPVRARRVHSRMAVDILQGLSGYFVRPGFLRAWAPSSCSGFGPAGIIASDFC